MTIGLKLPKASIQPRWSPAPLALGSTGNASGMIERDRHALAQRLTGGDRTAIKPRSRPVTTGRTAATESEIFDNRTILKVAAGQVAMHLSASYRAKLFAEVDRLLSTQDWDDDSSLIDPASFRTYLRTILFARVAIVPTLGVSGGFLLASWGRSEPPQRIYIRFLPKDIVSAVGSHGSGKEQERFSFSGPARLFRQRLAGAGFNMSLLDGTTETT